MIGQYHSIVLHVPILLFFAALVADIMYYYGKERAVKVGHWLVIAAVVACIPTILTGLAAAMVMDPNDPILAKHQFLGYCTGVCGSLYAGLRISVMCWRLQLRPIYYLILSVSMVALVSWTSDSGKRVLPVEAHDAVTDETVPL